ATGAACVARHTAGVAAAADSRAGERDDAGFVVRPHRGGGHAAAVRAARSIDCADAGASRVVARLAAAGGGPRGVVCLATVGGAGGVVDVDVDRTAAAGVGRA